MTQAKPRFSTFNEYLSFEDGTDNRYELVNGELIELPPEAEPNDAIANYLFLMLVEYGVPFRLVKPHSCEVQVPIVKPGDAANRYPDLVVLRREHLELTQRRLTITLEMPPPVLIAEVVSPGKTNRDRDDKRKREQYAKVGIPEFWLIDPQEQLVIVLELGDDAYSEVGAFRGEDRITSPTYQKLMLTAEELLKAEG
jgi:Uma2 family endonuclease